MEMLSDLTTPVDREALTGCAKTCRQLAWRKLRATPLAPGQPFFPLFPCYCRAMDSPASTTVLDDLLDPLSRCLDEESARRVAEFRIGPSVQARVDVLAERANDGTLTEEERDEYDSFIDATDLIAILQIKAQQRLEPNGA